MNERLKCILIAISIDMILLGCVLILFLLAYKCKIAFVIIGIIVIVSCTYKAVKEYRLTGRLRKPFDYVPKGDGD